MYVMWPITRAAVPADPTEEKHAEKCEEEVVITGGLIGFPTENYLAKQRHEQASLCLQVYIAVWFLITLYVIWTTLTLFP